jgi:hypothetical protein
MYQVLAPDETSPRPWKRPRAVLIATKRVTSDERKGFSGRKNVEAIAIFLQTFLHTAVSKDAIPNVV